MVEPEQINMVNKDAPDGIHLWIGHPKGPQGRTSNLTYVEYVERGVMRFDLEVRQDKDGGDAITYDQWAELWTEAERQGLGALRSQGFGTFKVTGFDKLT